MNIDETTMIADGGGRLARLRRLPSSAASAVRRRACMIDSRLRTLTARPEEGAVTAEYTVVLLAATGFGALLLVILKSDTIKTLLTNIVKQALNVG
ncbi:DUF4244 domain-containing protein [Bifidobacterium leontopitheci]|uniref:DUF4244 domain-containing protein n=1 Tax=Bifidobacterium leontopitheci TaxID=2650774 RepID=A0A6I1GKQ2_9BIFI|nr:DUF4244 domain-containing protein [Bifidobacterium leontopitheci]KAB7789947.1 hypothetical protein F7D09_1560 [Bifidobacterium leontopitheci]